MNNIEAFKLKWSHENPLDGAESVPLLCSCHEARCDSSTQRSRIRLPEVTQPHFTQRGRTSIPSRELLFFFCFLVSVRSKGHHS